MQEPNRTTLASDGTIFCDTNCLFVTREAFHLLSLWARMPKQYHPIGDRVMWHYLGKSGLAKAHSGLATVCYRATHEGFYRDLHEIPPEGVKRAHTNEIPPWLLKLGKPQAILRLDLNGRIVSICRLFNNEIQRKPR